MKNVKDYLHKHVLVIGLAKSGLAAAKLLHRLGANVTVNDVKATEEDSSVKELMSLGIKVIGGGHPLSLIDENPVDIIVKNPGIPYLNPLIARAKEKNLPIITEVELAYKVSEADIIAITGSNGKTTTTTLIYEMLKVDQKLPLIAGNIGTVACEVAEKATKENVIVMELSSFQLLGTIDFKPAIAMILNIFDAHLDYHGTKDEYVYAKGKIYENQTNDDVSIININDNEVYTLSETSRAQKIYFSTSSVLENGVYIKDECIWFKGERVINIKDIVLPGEHNLENILAAITAVKLRDVSNEAIYKVLTTFQGVKHRLQYVDSVEGRRFYNDSKATNILATSKALQAFSSPTILLAGGLDRGNEFDELKPFLKSVKAMILFGETAPKLERIAKESGIEHIKRVDNVEKAVSAAFNVSENDDVVLLSPACASWDQYKTFEERGDIFIQAVHKLK
ncbi:UDP-N-acetylmuramoyl-L-alanine--D-glutamate ligase [Metabacillus halosaccharovorans]|uniref:UDP-N-acetylmuramoyl-L-alanine--D-glutamate ligase n=1 Tax=Metabacillus halosaccharovorans TaxID=930124 RepID=UPI001C1FD264|nr:UDP-N-acetylmuramoyl-L-alanine--D-glutamate ligase [Metabacillus halosaccharovorans]MBU7592016.1 UDP-N-acetylmuramoyl-L-alanine--D-glutamate ligase [Metabacillus halosaccharovorans]